MPQKDQPPQHIWLNDEALNEHFERVMAKASNPESADDDVAPLSQNELTKGLRSG